MSIFKGIVGRSLHELVLHKDDKGGYGLVIKIKDEGFEADLYIKHCCMCTLCTVQYRHTGWIVLQGPGKFLWLIYQGLSNKGYNLNVYT
jgi:hypothetical protein